ncbi:MAG: ribonuclease J, partial [Acidobacteriota bacterium]
MNTCVEVVPLGGLGEFGMNCAALRCGQDMLLIDAGIAFPSGNLGGLGIDLIVPDTDFLKQHQEQLRGILLTHGHEDHIGAVSYILNQVSVPVYGSRLTLGLVAERLKERGLYETAQLHPLESRQRLDFGVFQVEPLHLTHSFPDAFCFALGTPVGTLIWTGDFKFDQTPIDGRSSDMARLAQYGEEGVLALFSDSTNSTVPGLSPSEFSTREPLRSLFRKSPAKILISCFASSIHRIQIILDLAREFHRRVVVRGRSMLSNIRVATELGYLRAAEDLLISPRESENFAPSQLVVLAAGSQGEPMSAMSRLAVNEVKNIAVEAGDTVILSARIIPGNERLISNMINHFCRRGARIYDSRSAPIHASGHGFRDDLKIMMNLTRPHFFVPIHGEFQQLKSHALLAADQGISEENIHLIENGDVLELGPSSAAVTGEVRVGRRFIDEGHRKEVDQLVVRDRRFLSEDGFLVVVLRMDRFGGDWIGE